MARAGAIAERKEMQDRDFYAAKRQIARFYMEHILPQAGALARIVDLGEECLATADADLL